MLPRVKFPLRSLTGLFLLVLAGVLAHPATALSQPAAPPAEVELLSRMSLEELANVEVMSVSKFAQRLSAAAAAIYVISRDEMLRFGVTSVPEALRLAPNLQVTQLGSSNYVVTARGFGGNPDAQNFSNKLLILIDGRSVYTPLFSGIYWDAQDVVIDDVDRIEVISGPGATLWGANAMNGVINIITRPAAETKGTLVRAGGGNYEKDLSLRYGAELGEASAYRVYAKAFDREAVELADGSSANDAWWKAQGGFRLDSTRGAHSFTTQGDFYRGMQDMIGTGKLVLEGVNLLTRWRRNTDRSQLQVQAYYDHTERSAPIGGVAFWLRTFDLELQQAFSLGSVHNVVWGGGVRSHDYDIRNSVSLLFMPPHRTLTLGNVFAQDTIALGKSLKLSLGLKFEKDPYEDWTPLPDARLSWQISDHSMMWAAASKAIRSRTPFDIDVVERVGGADFLRGNPDFETEKVIATEIGLRSQPVPAFSFSMSVFHNDYDDLRTIEITQGTFVPLRWDNRMEGETYGVEAWASWQINGWWRLSPGFRSLHKDLKLKPGASGILGLAQAGNDPEQQGYLKSSMDLGRALLFEAMLRRVESLPSPATDAYYELSARIGWRATETFDVSVTGLNLLNHGHSEFAAPAGAEITRNIYAEARWVF